MDKSIALSLDGESKQNGNCGPQRAPFAAAAAAAPPCWQFQLSRAIAVVATAAHTLGNALRDVMWAHPHVQLASYTQEHPSSTEIIVRCQTSGAISAEQGVVESLQMAQATLRHISASMDAAVQGWQQLHPSDSSGSEQAQQQQQPGSDDAMQEGNG